jgi:hypothetical protein
MIHLDLLPSHLVGSLEHGLGEPPIIFLVRVGVLETEEPGADVASRLIAVVPCQGQHPQR